MHHRRTTLLRTTVSYWQAPSFLSEERGHRPLARVWSLAAAGGQTELKICLQESSPNSDKWEKQGAEGRVRPNWSTFTRQYSSNLCINIKIQGFYSGNFFTRFIWQHWCDAHQTNTLQVGHRHFGVTPIRPLPNILIMQKIMNHGCLIN